jgi:membrane-bound lytic murein transglycosylase B
MVKTHYIVLAAVLLLFHASHCLASRGRPLTPEETAFLLNEFQKDHPDSDSLQTLFTDARLLYLPGRVKQNVFNKEYAASYQGFLCSASLRQARTFYSTWKEQLEQVSRSSGVDPHVLTAILLVETRFGQYLGRIPVTSVFASIVLDSRPDKINALCNEAPEGAQQQKCRQRVVSKSTWARRELESLLTIRNRFGIDILNLRGSYAGAFGIPQFLPSSYLRYASHAGESEYADLFHMPDAIASVGNYLRGHGWRPGLSREEQEKVIWTYNNSRVYVETVLKIADLLAPEDSPPAVTSDLSVDADQENRS